MAVVQKHWRATFERVEKFISDTYFTDVNLRGRLYPESVPVTSLKAFKVEQVISFEDAVLRLKSATEVDLNYRIGPTWTTHWFECKLDIPAGWTGRRVRFRWDSGCEAMIWTNGKPLQGLTGGDVQHRYDFTLTDSAQGGESFCLYIEAAANGMFGAGMNGMINPPNPEQYYAIRRAEVAVFDVDVYSLLMDLRVLLSIAKSIPQTSHRAFEALYKANEIINGCTTFSSEQLQVLHKSATDFFQETNGSAQLKIHAFGHCHIDCAWLWPYSETIRKCARSWASQILLMKKYSSYVFACSQVQQLAWVKEHYPSLFDDIKEMVKSKQFLPVGGTWVEMDGNIPSGEAFVRQFLYGQEFFRKEFGLSSTVFWLPDTFGYSAQLPQIAVQAGMKYFLTQKISWNLTNKFPHNTFMWEGLDGTSVLTHFPPADTYGSDGSAADVLKTESQFKDKGRSRSAILLFGHGDGGGGPTEDMLESLKRLGDVDGIPKVTQGGSPQAFFQEVEDKDKSNLCAWKGELYLELHRGTYTTQAQIKKYNRQVEFLLHQVEFLLSLCASQQGYVKGFSKEMSDLKTVWHKMLLNQFHDVLPGSSIEKVHVEVKEIYEKDIIPSLTLLQDDLLRRIVNKHSEKHNIESSCLVFNSLAWERREVVNVPLSCSQTHSSHDKTDELKSAQKLSNGDVIAMTQCPGVGYAELAVIEEYDKVSVTEVGSTFVLENAIVKATVTSDGVVSSLLYKKTRREAVAPSSVANQMVIFDDVPLFWDAWDVMEYHLETRCPLLGECVSIQERGPLRAAVSFTLRISKDSTINQVISLEAESPILHFDTQVDWHESHKILKVEFPVNVKSLDATYEIQFGHVKRPTHFNTSWDQARFEVSGHKWVDLSEYGFGVSLLNDCKYGHSTRGSVMSLSLLRSPKTPDGNSDMGKHSFSYGIMPHEGSFQDANVIQYAYNFNSPLLLQTVKNKSSLGPPDTKHSKHDLVHSLFTSSNPAVILETIKLREDLVEDCLVVRFYESFGAHSTSTITSSVNFTSFKRCSMLEECDGFEEWSGSFEVQMYPFEIVTYKLLF